MLLLRTFNAGMLLKHIRQVNSLQINEKEDFGETGHSLSSEPYFYESSYKYCFQRSKLTIDQVYRCITIENCIPTDDQYTNNVLIAINTNVKAHITDAGNEKQWPCSYVCHTLNDNDVDTILNIKGYFQ